jgi:hypothetical protein
MRTPSIKGASGGQAKHQPNHQNLSLPLPVLGVTVLLPCKTLVSDSCFWNQVTCGNPSWVADTEPAMSSSLTCATLATTLMQRLSCLEVRRR